MSSNSLSEDSEEEDPTESTKEFYNNHVDEYIANVAKRTHVPSHHSELFARHVGEASPTPKILEVGCGYGRDAAWFAKLEGWSIIGTDYSRSMLNKAQQDYVSSSSSSPCITFMEMDMRDLGKHFLPNSFDGIWACATIIHLPKHEIPEVLRTWFSLLREGGIVYVSVKEGQGESFDPDLRYGGIRKYYAFYSQEELVELITRAGFAILESGVDDHRGIDSYATHPFLYVLARKPKATTMMVAPSQELL